MHSKIPTILLLALNCAPIAHSQILFRDQFDTAASISQYNIIGEQFVRYTTPPLHEVSVESGFLKIETSVNFPNGINSPPALFGSAVLMRQNGDFGFGFASTLSNNAQLLSWSFNVANEDGTFNNGFDFILGSTHIDPTAIAAKGYQFSGGGMLGNRMVVSRYNSGTGGGKNFIIDITNGLAPLPQMGSIQITFDPTDSEWRLYGLYGASFQEPTHVNSLLGVGFDSMHGSQPLPYWGFGGKGTGVNYFDNVTISLIPEPSSSTILAGFLTLITLARRRKVKAA